MPDEVTVTVRYLFKPGMEIIGRQLLSEFIELNRKEPGCLDTILHRDRKNPASFMTISHWESMDKFMELLNLERVKTSAEKGKQLLARGFEVEIWTALGKKAGD